MIKIIISAAICAGFNGSNLAMFYQTGDITINGTVSVTGGVNMMVEGSTHVTSTGTYSLTSYLVNVGYLEADASSTLTTLDDLSLTGNSITIINTNSTTADDLNIDFTDATLCGTGTSTLLNSGGSAINYTNSATVNQICTTFVVNCSGGGCSGFPVTGTGTSIGNTGPGGVDKNDGTGFLEFWLDSQDVNADGTNPANGSAVVTWSDKSGNNVDVTQNIANVAPYSASGVTFNNTGYLLGSDATSYVKYPDKINPIRDCKNYIHQLDGLFEMLGLSSIRIISDKMEQLVEALVTNKIQPNSQICDALKQCNKALLYYLNELIDGKEENPLRCVSSLPWINATLWI